jgi:predicted helicase
MAPLVGYLAAIAKNLAHGDATEHTHRPALKVLLESAGKDIIATNEPTRILCGAPDFNVTRGNVPLGHIETKDIGENLALMQRGKPPHGEQFGRYRDGLPNWILTDYLEFRWYVNGEHRLTARLGELDGKGELKVVAGGEEAVASLLRAFLDQKALTIRTAKDLAQRMAGMTRIIRDLIIRTFDHEVQRGLLHNWLAAFREVLIPDLDEQQFADMFAQTLAYGLFAARIHTPPGEDFSREMAAYNLPKTNPFLRRLFAEMAGVDMPETIGWAVTEVVELLRHADLFSILKDFGKGKGKEDPVVHFYETFLAVYDPEMREVRGVFYTPGPAVGYLVRSIDCLLKSRLGLRKGLADESTLVLDPATGTATFLYFVIEQIYRKFAKQKGAWDGYVDKHLLKRIFGFELLIAPYAIAHLKLGMLLQETGYSFASGQRLGIYLTNTLEAAAKHSEHVIANWISEEANAAAMIKRDEPVLVVLGNPPYSGDSANRSTETIRVEKGATYIAGLDLEQGRITRVIREAKQAGDVEVPSFIGELLADYYVIDGARLNERNPKWLQNDYVKFIRFAQWRIDKTGEGIVAYVTSNSYLDSPTFRGMRRSLMRSFSEIYIYNLHGNAKKRERAPDGGEDKNIFDITEGVALLLAVKVRGETKPGRVFHADLWGAREAKYQRLRETDVTTTEWSRLEPSSPSYLFVPLDTALKPEYDRGYKITEAMPVHSLGIATARDSFCVGLTKNEVWNKVRDFVSLEVKEAREKYGLGKDARDWKVALAQGDLAATGPDLSRIVPILYRPFDTRFTYYTGKSRGFHCMPRNEVMRHMLPGSNIALSTVRSVEIKRGWEHCLCASTITQLHTVSLKEVNYLFPLYLEAPGDAELRMETGRRPNLSPAFLAALAKKLKLPQAGEHRLPKGITPEDVFHYAYAVFHSPTYRARYAEFLRMDFPCLPLTSDIEVFRALARKGAKLAALHLMESPHLGHFIPAFPVKGSNEVEKAQYTDIDQRVWINPRQYFAGVPKAAWEFHIGGYQVCEKWLEDRKGRKLTYDDLQHYQKIVVALQETIRLMGEIDAAIPAWPLT